MGAVFYLLRFSNGSTQNRTLKMFLNRRDAVPVGNLSVRGAIHDIERINSCAILRVDTRKRDRNPFGLEARQNIVKQAEPVRSLDLDQCVSGMCFVVHGNARRKFNSWREKVTALPLCFFD